MIHPKKRMPPARARHLGHAAALKRHPVLTGAGDVDQDIRLGAVIEVYDDLSWERFTTTPRDEREFLRGYAIGLSRFLNATVHLVFVHSRGNGHNDYRICAGLEPRKRRGPKRVRRVRLTRKLKRIRKNSRFYAWFDGEAKAIVRALGQSGWEAEVRARREVIKRSRDWLRSVSGYAWGSRAEIIVALRGPA